MSNHGGRLTDWKNKRNSWRVLYIKPDGLRERQKSHERIEIKLRLGRLLCSTPAIAIIIRSI
jgi:hypothetical protein